MTTKTTTTSVCCPSSDGEASSTPKDSSSNLNDAGATTTLLTRSQRRFGFVVNSKGFDVHSIRDRIDLLAGENETVIDDEECYARCVCYRCPAKNVARGCDRKNGGCHVHTTEVYSRTGMPWPNPYVHWVAPSTPQSTSSIDHKDDNFFGMFWDVFPAVFGILFGALLVCFVWMLIRNHCSNCHKRQQQRDNTPGGGDPPTVVVPVEQTTTVEATNIHDVVR